MDQFCSCLETVDDLISRRRFRPTVSRRAFRSLCSPAALAESPSRMPPRPPVRRRLPAFCLFLFLVAFPADAALPDRDGSDAPLKNDARLQQTLTVRVSRMPLSELLKRIGDTLNVRLVAQGEDVSDQKIDLFARDLQGLEILTAITGLLNSEGPQGYRWERSGSHPNYRYQLVRDLASRQWEAQRAAEVEARLANLLRDRLRSLRSEPFTPRADRPLELPAMRKLLCVLTDAQVTQLAAERFLRLSVGFDPEPSALWRELSEQAVGAALRRDPAKAQQIAGLSQSDLVRNLRVDIRLLGDPTQYRVHVGVNTTVGGGMSQVCRFGDPAAMLKKPAAAPPVDPPLTLRGAEPAFALPPRASWLMGDVLADLAARANVNLIADDYTVEWSDLERSKRAQPLSNWLDTIEESFGFAVARDGHFLRLRNRRWWSDKHQEVPQRLVTRWAALDRGSSADRLQALVEIARSVPFSTGFSPTRDRLSPLRATPEMMELVPNPTDPERNEFVYVAAWLQPELRVYELLPAPRQEAIREQGLTLMWDEMPPPIRTLFSRAVCDYWEPGIPAENLRGSGLFLRFNGDHLSVRYLIQGIPPGRAERTRRELDITPAQPVRAHSLVGQIAPELHVEDATGKTVAVQPRGPLLLYFAPVWPRPVVTRREEFADLRALQRLQDAGGAGPRVLVGGIEATAAELRTWWRERGLTLPPLALTPESEQQLGMRHLPVAVVVDGMGRVQWLKEGYAPGDEDEWRRQLDQAGK